MVHGVIARLMSVAAVLAVAAVVGFAPAAHAGPKVTAVTISSKGMADITVQAKERGEVFELLVSEVSWLANATPHASASKAAKLGPKYTVTLLTGTKAQHVYELYPLATGGPRAHRPAKQPRGKATAGWFFGRFTMSESLRVSGVPLEARSDVINGGIGGGVGEQVRAEEIDPVASVNEFLDQVRRLFLLNGAVLVVILFGLAGISFLIRRRV